MHIHVEDQQRLMEELVMPMARSHGRLFNHKIKQT
jgi:hypothetical protein